jgi:hypothetical protein
MAKTLTNNKGVALMIVLLVFLFLSILSIDSFSLASAVESSESSTAQTYYDSLIDYQQEQVNGLIKFKGGIGRSIASLKEDIIRLNLEIKSGQHKYTYNKGSAVLGSLYGSRGKLGFNKSKYSRNPDILSSVTAVTDTKTLGTPASTTQPTTTQPTTTQPTTTQPTTTQPTTTQPPIVCTTVCHPECHQVGYGQVCTQVCTQVCN